MEEEKEYKEFSVNFQPDLLSEEDLIKILTPRCINKNLEKLSKEDLVELFNRIALPLPQRKYNSSWRGRHLTKKREILEAGKPTDSSFSSKIQKNGLNILYKSSLSTKIVRSAKDTKTDVPKGKPLPDQINYERKIIKLSGLSSKSSSSDSIVITNKRKSDSLPEKDRTPEKYKEKRHIIMAPGESKPKNANIVRTNISSEKLPKDCTQKRPRITGPDSSDNNSSLENKASKKICLSSYS